MRHVESRGKLRNPERQGIVGVDNPDRLADYRVRNFIIIDDAVGDAQLAVIVPDIAKIMVRYVKCVARRII